MERKRSRAIQNARLEAMFQAPSGTHPDVLMKLADDAERVKARKIGENKQHDFAERMRVCYPWLIKEVRPATSQEDHNGIDFWLPIRKNRRYSFLSNRILPVQVKSSPEDVDDFRNSDLYIKNFKKRILVIDYSIKTPKDDFMKQMNSELTRINYIYSLKT